jgi:hypothetical protein
VNQGNINLSDMNEHSMNHLVIGRGGAGGKSIRALRKLIFSEQKLTAQSAPNVDFLYIDSSREMMSQTDPTWKVLGKSVQLPAASQLQITGEDLSSLLENVSNYPGIRNWIGSHGVWKEILGTIVGEALGGQKRRLGRFLFARKINEFKTKVQTLVQGLQANGEAGITFHVIAGLAGGTGSGSIVDVLAQLRNAYADSGRYCIIPYLLLPDQYPSPNWDTGNYHANGFAALTEINALSTGAYKPVDISTGNQINRKDVFKGAYLISNENENGYMAKVNTEVPGIIAEFLFQKIFIAGLVGSSIARMENAENGDPNPETSATSKTGERSKRFLSFGIKRISIPEEEIKEYLTLSFAQQGVHQLRFNNWQQAIRFADESKNFDANAMVRAADMLADWKLSDDYLLFTESTLGSDDLRRSWKSLVEEWASVMPTFRQLAQQQEPKAWVTSLSSFYQKRFDESFRNLGVKEFYRVKELSKIDMAKEIRKMIDKDLLKPWKNGSQSLQEINIIIDTLSFWLQEKLEQIDVRVAKIDSQLDELRSQVASNLNDWASLGIWCKAIGKRDNIFGKQSILLQNLYIELTKVEAHKFAKSLLYEVVSEVRDFKTIVSSLAKNIQDATMHISRDLDERLTANAVADSREHVISFYEPTGVKTAIKDLVVNEPVQAAHASKIRSMMMARLGNNLSFTRLSERLSVVDLVNSVISASEDSALAAHSNIAAETNRRILGVSILSKLEERYGSDGAELRLKIHELINQAGIFLTINPLERDKAAPGIPSGSQVLVAKTIVLLPKAANKEGFIKVLKDAFRASMSGDLGFIDTENQQNEITILTIKNLFPVRMVGILPFLQEKCNERLNGNRERIEMEIFTSGSLADYPSLFAQSGSDLRKLAGVQILLGLALGLVVKSPPGGLLVFNSKDLDGFDEPPIELGNSILNSMVRIAFVAVEKITLANQIALKSGVDASLAEAKIKSAVEDYKSETGNDLASLEYQLLVYCAKNSLKLIREVAS